MWNPPQTMPPATASYAPPSFHQSYERLHPGGDPNFYSGVNNAALGQHANHSFTTRYYEAQNPDEVFPRPIGSFAAKPNPEADHGSFHSVALQSNQGSFHSAAPPPPMQYEAEGRPRNKQRGRPMSDYVQYCKDKSARLVVWIVSLFVIALSVYTFFRTVQACFSEDFSVVSELAWESWCGSLLAVVVVMSLLALLEIFLAIFGIIVGMKETKALLRVFYTSSALLGIILVLLVLVAWAMGSSARPYATRAMNLMCQERDIFGCLPPASTPAPAAAPASLPTPAPLPTTAPLPAPAALLTVAPTPSPLLSGLPRRLGEGGGEDVDRTELSWSAAVALVAQRAAALDEVDNLDEASAAGAAPRRLDAGEVAVAFTTGLGKESSGKAGVCRRLERYCSPPANFDSATACVCSGQWDFLDKVSETPSPAPPTTLFTPAPAPGVRRLRSLDDDSTEAGEDRGSASSASAAARRLSVDPWKGTHGAFCRAWTEGDTDEWCFVSAQQRCHRGFQVPVVSSKGAKLVASRGPCTDMVDSRTILVPMGIHIMEGTLEVVGCLGIASLLMSVCALVLYRHPSKATVWSQVAPARKNDHYGYGYQKPMAGVHGDDPLREQRFQDAQREATRKLTDQTPEDLKLMLYGFYRQAKEGDIKGERPGFWNKKELAKWEYWSRHQGLSREQAIEGYIRTVALLD